ncbi:MAG: hypothetical protein IJH12_06205 [Clostridia bacterium]|nr:hypothetical protein [Clostridia bacterium]
MRKFVKSIISIGVIMALLLPIGSSVVNAAPSAPPDGGNSSGAPGGNGGAPGKNGGAPGGGSSANVTHTGATTISSDTTNSGSTYSSTTGSENALLVTGGTSTLSNVSVNKSGDSDGDEADFYGVNAAVMTKDGTLNINGGTITTNGSHANGVFAYSSGKINISDATIKTSSNNSGAIMVTGGGTLTANNVTATTDGNSSAPIRSDRGGGTLTVNGGTYTANGVGSPAIYSTADITVNNATLTSTSSEGAVVEGKNSITLNNTTLTDTNTSLNGNSETYKNIFLYQSMSGDADVGNSSFTAKDSTITTNKGDTIFVTNTTATISLENNTIVNNDSTGGFLRIQSGKWGTSGSNGGDVTLNATNQQVNGNVYVDNVSALAMSISSGSSYEGTINADNTAKTLAITLDSSSTLTLTGDSYITSLNNAASDNSNINLNGYTLYVNGTAITSTNYTGASTSTSERTEGNGTDMGDEQSVEEDTNDFPVAIVVGSAVGVIIVIVAISIVIKKRTK